MSEQSHKREMAAAVRGDFARLRQRGVATTLHVPTAEESEQPPATEDLVLPRDGLGTRAETHAEPPAAEGAAAAPRRSAIRRLFERS
ncbi:MAG: hypothetical protein OEW31_03020 [Thermoleophilia bacterium]|nr:hypothetical protein [Thermoleophilia bacterium]